MGEGRVEKGPKEVIEKKNGLSKIIQKEKKARPVQKKDNFTTLTVISSTMNE